MMNLANDKIEPLIARMLYNGEDNSEGLTLSEHLSQELIAVGNITYDLLRLRSLEQEAKEDHTKIMADLGAQRIKIQDSCLHYSTTYYGDASGGSDSHTKCDICGLEL